MTPRPGSLAGFVYVLAALPGVAGAGEPKAVFREVGFNFGSVLRGSVVERDFWLKNEGSSVLKVKDASMTPPLLITRMPREVAPGGTGAIHFRLDTATLHGRFNGQIVVRLDDPISPEMTLSFEGQVLPPIEVSPLPAFFVSGRRGNGGSSSLEIVNHEADPLLIRGIDHPSERFTTRLETLQPGQRYKLTLMLKPDGPSGRMTDRITVTTSSRAQPTLEISANTFLHERVYSFPDKVDLGDVRMSQIRKNPEVLGMLTQTLMVYEEDGTDFQARISTDLPSLKLRWERGPRGDRYQATISLDPEQLSVGSHDGVLLIETNDPLVPKLAVPVVSRIRDE